MLPLALTEVAAVNLSCPICSSLLVNDEGRVT
jgi:hypothetical protein